MPLAALCTGFVFSPPFASAFWPPKQAFACGTTFELPDSFAGNDLIGFAPPVGDFLFSARPPPFDAMFNGLTGVAGALAPLPPRERVGVFWTFFGCKLTFGLFPLTTSGDFVLI